MAEGSSSTIENDIAELERQLEAKKSALEHEKSAAGGEPRQGREKELLHGLVGEKIQQHVVRNLSAAGQTSPPPLPTDQGSMPITTEPPSYLSQELKDKIQSMVQIVFAKNLDEGIKEAVKIGNMAVLDAFHDILVDELYNQLLEKKKLEKID